MNHGVAKFSVAFPQASGKVNERVAVAWTTSSLDLYLVGQPAGLSRPHSTVLDARLPGVEYALSDGRIAHTKCVHTLGSTRQREVGKEGEARTNLSH